MTVLAATKWQSNADLIADVAELGYLKKDVRTLDPTYGRGVWWKKWKPDELVVHDLYTVDGVDFRILPHSSNEFAQVAYDPPYVCPGGRKTTTLPDFHDRFGMNTTPSTPAELQQLINDGLTEVWRVTAPKGTVLVKCQDYVSSGKLWIGTHHTLAHALELGFTCVDRFEHLGKARAQPGGRRQVHARRNLSTLFVLRKPPPKKIKKTP